ncbi:MAG: polysaccharide pyruvyl transferase family protein [Oscillospiraceae bacterium]|nr:polysaccharide pyruvyl transferase family protein [Oscillospiraceae bacterium]
MDHIFYQTKTYFSNTGDVLINSALIEALRAYGAVHANCSDDIPQYFLDALGIRPSERVSSNKETDFIASVLSCAMKSRKNGDRVFVFSGPGDMYGGGLKLVMRNLASALVFPLFRLYGVHIVRIGRSVGPISKLMAFSERVRCAFLTHYYVRDSWSLARCRKHGMKKVKQCPDLSWLYDSDHAKRVNTTNTVMVNLRNSIFDEQDAAFVEDTLQKCEELLCALNEYLGGKMKVCVAYQIAEDKAFSRVVYNRLSDRFDVQYIEQQLRLDEFEEYYGAVDYHITNRMHSLLAGYKYGSLPIALIDTKKHVKIAATFFDCSLTELMIDIHERESGKVVQRLAANREELLQRIFDCEKKQTEEMKRILDGIFEGCTE